MKRILTIILIGGLIIGLTGCGKSDKDKMLEILQEQGFKCLETSHETKCTMEDAKKKKTFELDEGIIKYEEVIYDAGTVRLKIDIDNTKYNDSKDSSGTSHYYGIIDAYFKGEDIMEFYPENCTDKIECHLHVGEKVYPELKETYDKYLDYFNSEEYYELKSLWKKSNKSLSEKYRETSLEINYELIWEPIKDKDKFTENVNDAARFYEKILEEAGIKLEK